MTPNVWLFLTPKVPVSLKIRLNRAYEAFKAKSITSVQSCTFGLLLVILTKTDFYIKVVKVVWNGDVSLCSHHSTVSAIINFVAISNLIMESIKVGASEMLWLFLSALAVLLFRTG